MTTEYNVGVQLDGGKRNGLLTFRDRSTWKTKRIAARHAQEYSEAQGACTLVQDADMPLDPRNAL